MSRSTPADRQARIDLVKEAARAGGQAIAAALPSERVVEKDGRGNFVTAADEASEQAILRLIQGAFPGDVILSEESQPEWEPSAAVPHLWVIDPLDGTNNFRFGRRYCAVSVAYVEGGEPRAAAVYDPFHDELFFAQSAGGAVLNDRPIRVGDRRHLPTACVATDNCYAPQGTRRNLELCLRIDPPPWVLVRGSAVLSLCEVACGRTDLYFHTALMPWDNAAAFLIVREAGGQVCQFDGAPADLFTRAAVAGNADLVEQALALFRAI